MESVGEFEYNAKDLIGHGAFAVVFKGRNKKTPAMTVAIKSITKKNISKSHNLLGKEIKILKELSEVHHENIVGLLDCQETQHHVFLVMEYCNGGDLADYLSVKGTLSEDTIRNFLKQLAGAMRALQLKGIVHRDLKPQNILLSHAGRAHPQPNDIRLKIADFGFARFLQDGVMAATLCGSPMYMAPEVIMSLQYDAKADLWSLGTIVFQCLTGRAPFTAQTPQALKMFYERNHNLSPKIPAGTSPELTVLLQGLLRRNARERIEFDDFFNHAFIRKTIRQPTTPVSPPLPVPSSPSSSAGVAAIASSPSSAVAQQQQQQQQRIGSTAPARNAAGSALPARDNNNLTGGRTSPPEEAVDDFVLVPSPSAQQLRPVATATAAAASSAAAMNRNEVNTSAASAASGASQPIPVPSQRGAFLKLQASHKNVESSVVSGSPPSPAPASLSVAVAGGGGGGVAAPVKADLPRSQPISVAKKDKCVDDDDDDDVVNSRLGHINSLSPPSIQFCVGTPPGITSRRRSTSGSSCGGSPPPFSSAGSPWPTVNSPLRRVGSHFPAGPGASGGSGPLAPIIGSPTKLHLLTNSGTASAGSVAGGGRNGTIPEWNPLSPAHPSRAMTLPEFSSPPLAMKTCNPAGGGYLQRSQTDVTITTGSPCGSRSPSGNPFFAGAMSNNSNGSYWNLQRKPSFDQTQQQLAAGGGGGGGGGGGVFGSFGTSPPQMEGPIVFIAPELTQETLMEKEHNDTLAKLNFVLALVECILEVARARASPLAAALSESIYSRSPSKTPSSPSGEGGSSSSSSPALSEIQRRAEQLVLNIRALQLLSSALSLSREELQAERLHSSTSVKQVVRMLYERFDQCLCQCKKLNGPSLGCQLADSNWAQLTADKLLYNHAIELCQSAALDELFGNPASCCRRYQTAHILFHSLAQQVTQLADKSILNKYREAVEKRLFVLQQQGYIHAYDTT